LLNILWPIFIIISFIYAIFSGKVDEINSSIFTSVSDAVSLCITLLRKYVFVEWNYENSTRDYSSGKNNQSIKTIAQIFISRNTEQKKKYIMKYH